MGQWSRKGHSSPVRNWRARCNAGCSVIGLAGPRVRVCEKLFHQPYRAAASPSVRDSGPGAEQWQLRGKHAHNPEANDARHKITDIARCKINLNLIRTYTELQGST